MRHAIRRAGSRIPPTLNQLPSTERGGRRPGCVDPIQSVQPRMDTKAHEWSAGVPAGRNKSNHGLHRSHGLIYRRQQRRQSTRHWPLVPPLSPVKFPDPFLAMKRHNEPQKDPIHSTTNGHECTRMRARLPAGWHPTLPPPTSRLSRYGLIYRRQQRKQRSNSVHPVSSGDNPSTWLLCGESSALLRPSSGRGGNRWPRQLSSPFRRFSSASYSFEDIESSWMRA